MLEQTTNCIVESGLYHETSSGTGIGQFNTSTTVAYYPKPYYFYNSWPVYVCTDKTKKAIDILKALEADKIVKVQSVPKFIALVEKIAGIL